jgi:phosphotriesterase-related protein
MSTQQQDTRVGQIQTVRGLVPAAESGMTLMHEHVLFDILCRFEPPPPPYEELADVQVSYETRADLVFHAFGNRDNMRMTDEDVAAHELELYKNAGGSTVVDCTTIGIGRNPEGLQRLAERTGLNIVMGAGFYAYLCHPADLDTRSDEDIYEEIVRDIDVGVADTGIKCGIIGEIGCELLTDTEMRVLRAAASAQRQTGAMLNIHQLFSRTGQDGVHRILDTIDECGGDLTRTVISHMDSTGGHFDYQRSLVERGVTLEYDIFGYENCHSEWSNEPVQDVTRIRDIRRLFDAGYGDQIVVAHDVCFKTMLVTWGGHGFAHIPRRVIPGFRWAGFDDSEINAMLVNNPRRLLAFADPK